MHDPFHCQLVNSNDPNERNRMQTFAESFDHNIATWRFPVFEGKRDEKTLGYAQVVNIPVVFTAWNPKACKPRDIIDAMNWWKAWAITQNNYGLTTVPLETKSFYPKVMEKLGFKRMNLELYET